MGLKIPWGGWDIYGNWEPNPRLMMSTAEQYKQNVENGYIDKHRAKSFDCNAITLERRQIFHLGLAKDTSSTYYDALYAKAKIRAQPFFGSIE